MQLCADIGGSFIDLAVVDEALRILHQERTPTPTRNWSAFVEVLRDARRRHARVVDPAMPVAVAVAGLDSPRTGLMTSANIPCAHGRPFADDLAVALGRPVVVTNDADAFVLAEALLGLGHGHERVFGIILGTGIGGGVVDRGQIVVGEDGIGGEWGHGQIIPRVPGAPDATPCFECGCGRWGCLDTVGSARGLERLHRFLHGTTPSSRTIIDGWEGGEGVASATVGYWLELVGGPLAMLLNSFPASVVPVGGGLSSVSALVAALDRQVRAQMLRTPAEPLLRPTVLGGAAGLLGATLRARQVSAAPLPV